MLSCHLVIHHRNKNHRLRGKTEWDASVRLGDNLDDTTSLLDLLLGQLGDESGLDDERLVDSALSEELVLVELAQVNDGDGALRGINLGSVERNELVEVDGGSEGVGGQLVVVPHTDLTEVTRMVLVEVGPVVVLTTGQTTTSRMLPVLSDTTVTGRDVSSVLSGVGESGRHC